MRIIKLLTLLILFGSATGQASAQKFGGKGLHIYPFFSGSEWQVNDAGVDSESGAGYGLGLGLGLTNHLAVFVDVTTANIGSLRDTEDYRLSHGDAGIRLSLGSVESPFRAYVSGAVTARIAEMEVQDYPVTGDGTGVTLGGGVQYFVGAGLGIDIGVRYTIGRIDELVRGRGEASLEPLINVEANSSRFMMAAVWYPFR